MCSPVNADAHNSPMRWIAALSLAAVAAGCAGGEGREPEERPDRSAPRKPTVVVALGDSISAGSPLWDPSRVAREQIGAAADPRSQYGYWAERRLGGVSFRNCGSFGERTDQIASRLERCAEGADALIVQGGINDIAQMRRVKSAAGNLLEMVRRGREMGLRVALVEVLPWNNGYPLADVRIRRLNRLIREIGREERVPVFPWYEALEDPALPGRMKPEWTIDGDHPSIEGYRRLADLVELP